MVFCQTWCIYIDIVEIRFGIANGYFRLFCQRYLPATCLYFRFRIITWVNNNGFYTKLAMCIDVIENWFGIANGQISSTFDSYLPATRPYFRFRIITSTYQWIFTKLGMCIDIVEIWFGIPYGQILSFYDWVLCPQHDSGGVLSFHVFSYSYSDRQAWAKSVDPDQTPLHAVSGRVYTVVTHWACFRHNNSWSN